MTHVKHTTKALRSEDVQRAWHLFDLQGKVLGREATEMSKVLIGKHKPSYSTHVDAGDYVVVINAQHVVVTGRKEQQKVYTRYSGYPGGLKKLSYDKLMAKDPRKVIENAVNGMLPKNRLRDVRMRRLYVYAHDVHPHQDKFTKVV